MGREGCTRFCGHFVLLPEKRFHFISLSGYIIDSVENLETDREVVIMEKKQPKDETQLFSPPDISDDDILEAMKEIGGYLDITPGTFKEVFLFAYNHAINRLTQSISAKDVMSKEVIAVKKETPLATTTEIMAKNAVSGVPVLEDDGIVVGVISEKDFLFQMGAQNTGSFMEIVSNCLSSPKCVAASLREQCAQDIMTTPAITVSEDTSVFEIAQIFGEKSINRVPVINHSGKLVGIVSRTDILQVVLYLNKKS